jgi:hypothetical protein
MSGEAHASDKFEQLYLRADDIVSVVVCGLESSGKPLDRWAVVPESGRIARRAPVCFGQRAPVVFSSVDRDETNPSAHRKSNSECVSLMTSRPGKMVVASGCGGPSGSRLLHGAYTKSVIFTYRRRDQ